MKLERDSENHPVIPGELALAFALVINTLGVILMLYSGSGISAISSVPYAFSKVFPMLTLGTWTYLFQGTLVLSLMILRRSFVPSYMFSFVVGFVFGKLLDVHYLWIGLLPDGLALAHILFYHKLCADLHRNCYMQPLRASDYSD